MGRATSSGIDLLDKFPASWRSLYERPVRFSYSNERYDFVALVRGMLDCPEQLPLNRLHEAVRPSDYDPCPPLRKGMVLAGMPVCKLKSKNKRNKAWEGSPQYKCFMELYACFIREVILPAIGVAAGEHLKFEAAVQ